ncbi:N-acetyltransferase [Pseudomonas syringae pv. actinidiae]|uniref:GNAT family N-acetyltransferase n=1 Tax=Pseudomonas syringae TaxID=317 RepID=UPI000BB59929|nr:GNAT family N-acetyltransferase [Pseudomonas syringae]PBK49588.1 GNAT family N-acetyltransferase [Pseudomonas syringae pv. actinidiae]PBK54248.1 GNAT family N-acetyltransferase [Pseudomonas syringae pv. actinidiae]RJX53466.1 N-acetyltransferase [Pseudomonas syringae pv. actinidiae]RJX55584.1 N-acetyltransferase [Pseudomonas syringae pv. actinidiae]RJX63856.1 N-acetyltransferase [Pseudomonas syringae pv. actinidiae]
MEFSTIPLDKSVDRKAFDCGLHPALNTYISQQASQDEKRNVSRTFMLVEDGQLIGYYTLANASVVESDLSEEQMKKMPRYPMPAVLLSRLAVDKSQQGKGVGKRLMSDFFRRVYAISKHSGTAFIIVDAKDEAAAAYYKSLEFIETKTSPLRLALSTGTIIQGFKALEAAQPAT